LATGGVGHAATASGQENCSAAAQQGVDTDIRSKSNEFFHLKVPSSKK
jgi:hypothetical protein